MSGAHGNDPRILALLRRRSSFASVFQPIVSPRERSVLGYEALLRLPPGTGFASTSEAFRVAVGTEWLVDLEMGAVDAHLGAARGLAQGRLFVNLSAPAFLDNRLKAKALAARVVLAGLSPGRVVLELTELVRVADPVRFATLLEPLRREGFRLAVDDFGAGFTDLRVLVELGPDFIKLDRSLVAGAASHPRKRVFLESLAALGRRLNSAIIAEGVEEEADLATLAACGVVYAQGYVIGAPGPLAEVLPAAAATPPPPVVLPGAQDETIGPLAIPQEGVASHVPVGHLLSLFETHSETVAVPVLAGNRALGLVTMPLLLFHLGHRYGYALWQDRPVQEFVLLEGRGDDRLPASATLEDAVEVVRSRPERRRFDPIVVETARGDYHGLLPVDVLLSEMARLKVEYALQANPLTGLPGSVALKRAAEIRLGAGQAFSIGHVDIDQFKPFNDRYGFSRGDEVLQLLAEILRVEIGRLPDDYLAHPGGDDFAMLVRPGDAEARAWRVAEEFTRRVGDLYAPEDRAAGGIRSTDRRGVERWFDILSLSIGIVHWRGEPGVDFRRLVEIAAEVKAVAKCVPGPAVVVNARALALAERGATTQNGGRP